MGQLDFKLKSACTFCVNRIESCIIYANNKTEHWLRYIDPKEQEDFINSARLENMLFMKKAREKQEELFKKQNKKFNKKKKKKVREGSNLKR